VGLPLDAVRRHALTQRPGQRALIQTQARLATVPVEKELQRAPSPLGVLLLGRLAAARWNRPAGRNKSA